MVEQGVRCGGPAIDAGSTGTPFGIASSLNVESELSEDPATVAAWKGTIAPSALTRASE